LTAGPVVRILAPGTRIEDTMADGPLNDPDKLRRMVSGELPPPGVAVTVGFELVSAGEGRAVVRMQAGPQHWNPMGTVHGGILCDLADAAMGYGMASTLLDGETFTTLELKANFLKPVWGGRLVAESRCVRRTRLTSLMEADVKDEAGSLVARASSTCLVLRGEHAAGR